MKNWVKVVIVIAAIVAAYLIFWNQAEAQEVSLSAGVSSGYIENGQVIGELGKVAIQPSLFVDLGNLSLSASGNAFVQDRDVLKDNDEIEISAAYGFALDKFNVSLGVAHDLYFVSNSDADETATEIVAGLSVDDAPLGLTLSASRNFADSQRWGHDWYVRLSGSFSVYGINVNSGIASSDADGWGFANAEGTASIDVPVGEITVSPGVTFVYIDSDTQHFVVGARVSF